MIDIRCRALDPSRARAGAAGRCQLAAGHEGPHALMFTRGGVRTMRTWRPPAAPGALAAPAVVDAPARPEGRPWARGYPVTAWDEPAARPAAVA